MMKSTKYDDPDDVEMNATANLVSKQQKSAAPDIPLCGFVSMQYYAPYFDVDTEDIKNRMRIALVSFKVKDNEFVSIWCGQIDYNLG